MSKRKKRILVLIHPRDPDDPAAGNVALGTPAELIDALAPFNTQPDGSPMLVVTISTTDPDNLRVPFVISSQFKKEATNAKWKPSPCSATW